MREMDLNKYKNAWIEGAKSKIIARSMNEDGLCLHAYGRTIENFHLYKRGELLPFKGWKEIPVTKDTVPNIMALL